MIPSSGCPPWPPDHPRTQSRTGNPTPPPGARPYSAVTQANWLLGFHEGFVKSGLETDDIEPRKRIGQCLQGLKTAMHLLTAFKAWISAHPEMMTKDVPRAYLQYLFDVCPDAKSVGR